jgi:hypothetical protein
MSLEKVFERAAKRALDRIKKSKQEDPPAMKRLEKKFKEIK